MAEIDQFVAALRRLCLEQGGPEVVAGAIRSSVENLKQILAGTPLPSGNPRGVGPGIRKKLTSKFPNWLVLPESQIEKPIPARLTPFATDLALLFDMIPASELIRRAAAYGAASKAIIDVLKDLKTID